LFKIYSIYDDKIKSYSSGIATRIVSLEWDLRDPMVLLCQYASLSEEDDQKVTFYFVTRDNLYEKDTHSIPKSHGRLVSLSIPNCVYVKPDGLVVGNEAYFHSTVIREYQGVSHDPQTLSMITLFCYNLAVGDVEEAMKGIKLIKNDSVWESMALMCIKKKNIKLAKICFGKLKHVRALQTIATVNDGHTNVIDAIQMYIHLGKYEEAKELMESTGSHELLVNFYQATNKWEQALEISASKCRLNLPLTFFNFANNLNETGDKSGAIAGNINFIIAYENSNASKCHITRMLMKDQDTLENYISSSKDPAIIKWGAQNAESHGDLQKALSLYSTLDDICSIVRVTWLSGKIEQALNLADSHPNNKAALYFIANRLEHMDRIGEAISYYGRSGSYDSAIRLAKEHKIDKELLHLALKSTEKHMNDVAEYFEKSGAIDKAIPLYAKSNSPGKAMSLCIKSNNIVLLESIAMIMNPSKDKHLLLKAAKFLEDAGAFESAMKILVIGQRFDQVVEICQNHDIKITQDLIENFEFPPTMTNNEKKYIIINIADLCFNQGSYQLASQQYALVN
jgi:intraflagellar transport protein 140